MFLCYVVRVGGCLGSVLPSEVDFSFKLVDSRLSTCRSVCELSSIFKRDDDDHFNTLQYQ